ncbi:MAG: hypothetical protein Hens3KO_17860 [Henriciella sp.]
MRRLLVALVVLFLTLGGIVTAGLYISYNSVEYATPSETPFGQDLILRMEGDGRTATVLEDFSFVDPNGRKWITPAGWRVDGASIPQSLWGTVGGPFSGRYRAASVIHDRYCDTKTYPWPEVHRAFYDAMIAAGVDKPKATFMYLAVYRFGPRWDALGTDTVELCEEAGTCTAVVASLTAEEYQPEFSQDALDQLESEVDDMFSSVSVQSEGDFDLSYFEARLDADVSSEIIAKSRPAIEANKAALLSADEDDAVLKADGVQIRIVSDQAHSE